MTKSPLSIEREMLSIDGVLAPAYVKDRLCAKMAGIDSHLIVGYVMTCV